MKRDRSLLPEGVSLDRKEGLYAKEMKARPFLMVCSFCGKSQSEVRKLIAGPSVFICDECISLCNDILSEETPSPE